MMRNVFFAAILGLALFGLVIPDADAGKRSKKRMCQGGDDDNPTSSVICEVDLPLEITGYVPCECELEVTDNDIDVFNNGLDVSNLVIGNVSAYCNTEDGFKVTMTSANGGLAHDGGGDPLEYTLDVASIAFTPTEPDFELESTIQQVNATDFENADVELTVDASGALEGDYSDTVTIEVAGIL
ncbi:hypothetical protein [Vibrio breoganii]